jgi:hypothetical protein
MKRATKREAKIDFRLAWCACALKTLRCEREDFARTRTIARHFALTQVGEQFLEESIHPLRTIACAIGFVGALLCGVTCVACVESEYRGESGATNYCGCRDRGECRHRAMSAHEFARDVPRARRMRIDWFARQKARQIARERLCALVSTRGFLLKRAKRDAIEFTRDGLPFT